MIHIVDGQDDTILDVITAPNIIDDIHQQSLENTLETYDFVTFSDRRFSQHLGRHNRIVIKSEGEGYTEFVIHEVDNAHDRGGLQMEVYCSATYLLLKKAKVIEPATLPEYTPAMHVGWALDDTEWQVGKVEGVGYRTLVIERHTDPYAYLKRVAREFGLELRFRVETSSNRVSGRYVDLLERIGAWRGREIEFGRDLIGIRRNEKTENLYTALVGIGPERGDGTRLEVLVQDDDALQRWGRNGQHLVGTYEPQSECADLTLSELRQYTRTELDKRIKEVVQYEANIADLENVPGMENKQIRFGDTIRIKDTKFNPPLYLEARVFEQSRSIVNKARRRVKLGDYTEFTEDEVMATWRQLQSEIRQKVSLAEVVEYTYDKETIDEKDQAVEGAAKDYADKNVTHNVEIFSTGGLVFKNGVIQTTLIARVYKGKEDVTDDIDANYFRWTRASDDPAGDEIWNDANYGGRKQVIVTQDDVFIRATFVCEIIDYMEAV